MRKLLFALCMALLFSFSMAVSAVPSVVTAGDVIETEAVTAVLFTDNSVEIDIGERVSGDNVRYAEINGVQSVISENGNKYTALLSGNNLLVEIVEKSGNDTSKIVKTQYFYIDAEALTVTKLNMDSYMNSYDERFIRATEPSGIRFKSHILTSAKNETNDFVIDEYGFIISTKEHLGDDELNFDSTKYIKGIAFNREDGTDIIYDNTNDEYAVFTGVLKNVPVEHYCDVLVCKTYTKLSVCGQVFVVYGEPMVDTVFGVASRIFAEDYTNLKLSELVFDYLDIADAADEGFSDGFVCSTNNESRLSVDGCFVSSYSSADTYNVYLAEYGELGDILSVKKSEDFVLSDGTNSFSTEFLLEADTVQTRVYVLTSDVKLAAIEEKLIWKPSEEKFYNVLSCDVFDAVTDFSELLDSDGNVSIIESVSIASSLNAKKNGKKVTVDEDAVYEHILEMDDASVIVDLSERNSVNLDGINFGNAEGEINEENGYLVGTSTVKANGGYDPQVVINGLMLEARNYNKMTVRMKFEEFEGCTSNLKNKNIQIFFKTNVDNVLTEAKSVKYSLKDISDHYDWFEFEIDLCDNEEWNNFITGIRFDPTNYNVKFYIDYIKFSKSDSAASPDWYEKYLDYAYENDIVDIGDFTESEFDNSISREDFLTMLVKALGEDEFEAINGDIRAIPDIDKNRDNAEIFLMLYKAGITLGFDENGALYPEQSLLRSHAASIINKIAVDGNRLSGSVDAVWESEDYVHDYEFDDEADLAEFSTIRRMTETKVENGAYSFVAEYDSYMIDDTVSIDADKYTKIKIRIKPNFSLEELTNGLKTYNVYFKPEDFDGDITHYYIGEVASDYYLDAAGWYVLEIDMCLHPEWEGNVSYFRFDPMNSAGSYKIDYIRFIKSEYADYPDGESLINAGYTETRLMLDEEFSRGFYVSKVDQSVSSVNHGTWQDYCEGTEKPLWQIGPWWQGTGEGFEMIDLWEDRDTETDVYTLADTYGVNTIVYNPELKSISQRLDATKIYNGQPHDTETYLWWPHQLIEQNPNYTGAVDKERNSAGADRMFVELDVRMTDFKNTTNPEGKNVCSYLIYFYLRPKSQPAQRIWFGLTVFHTTATTDDPVGLTASKRVKPNWSPDSAAHQYMYGMPQAVVFDGIENSFNPSAGVAAAGEEWKEIRLDVTPHIDRAIEWANRDNIFGFEVTKDDMYFDGVNIGYEIHGNYDATFEFKNFNIVSYNK